MLISTKMRGIPVIEHEIPAIEHSLREDSHVLYTHFISNSSEFLEERNLKTISQ